MSSAPGGQTQQHRINESVKLRLANSGNTMRIQHANESLI